MSIETAIPLKVRAPAERNVYSQDRIATHSKNPVGRASARPQTSISEVNS